MPQSPPHSPRSTTVHSRETELRKARRRRGKVDLRDPRTYTHSVRNKGERDWSRDWTCVACASTTESLTSGAPQI